MPTDLESIVIYLIVLATIVWLTRNLWKPRGKGSKCGADCGCDIAGKNTRHPLIQKIVEKRAEKAESTPKGDLER
jgi:hypothetical protein